MKSSLGPYPVMVVSKGIYGTTAQPTKRLPPHRLTSNHAQPKWQRNRNSSWPIPEQVWKISEFDLYV